MARWILVSQIVLMNVFIFTNASSNFASNEIKIKGMIETAGCPFVSVDQFFAQHVCILPGYEANEMPRNENETAQIVVTLFSALVLDVKERENRLTVKISQFLQWFDPRIKLNKHKKPDKMGIVWISQKNIDRIWHPNLDMYTKNLEDWKSLHEPNVYRKLVILTDPKNKGAENRTRQMESQNLNGNDTENLSSLNKITKLGALKAWKAIIRCVFDFASYPFDVQRCKFLQFGNQGMDLECNTASNKIEWMQKIGEFYVEIQAVGKHDNDSIGFDIVLERAVEPYLYQYYIPSMAIVFVSQISFIIPLNAIPGRVALVATQFLTLVNIFIHQIVSSLKIFFMSLITFENNILFCQFSMYIYFDFIFRLTVLAQILMRLGLIY